MIDKSSNQPLYLQIRAHILSLLRQEKLSPGDTMYSEHELAEQLGVSRLTVRKAYVELSKMGVLTSVRGKGTFVSESVRPEQFEESRGNRLESNRIIGILFPEITIYFGPILHEIEQRASKDGYTVNVMFNDSIERERSAIRSMLALKPAGIILTPFRKRSGVSVENYEELARSGVDFVMIGKPPFHISCDATYVDDVVGIFDVVQLLFRKGHRRFLFLTDSASNDLEATAERSEGFRLALKSLKPDATAETLDVSSGEWETELTQRLLSDIPVTAIVADGDGTASSAFGVIHRAGLSIPKAVSVVGYDNSSFCDNLQVRLSSVDPRKRLLGSHAYDLLKNRIEGPVRPTADASVFYRVIRPVLKDRESVGEALSPTGVVATTNRPVS